MSNQERGRKNGGGQTGAPARLWWQARGRTTARQLANRLASSMGLTAAAPQRVDRTYLDTFDWRLFGSCRVLVLERGDPGHTLVLQDRERANTALRVAVAGHPKSVADLPAGVRQQIGGVLAGRALIDVGHEQIERWPLRLLDDEGKTVVRVDVERLSGTEPMVRVGLSPVRGYHRAARQARLALDGQADLTPSIDPLVVAARASGLEPGVMPGPVPLSLEPTAGIANTLASVLVHELDVIVALEDSVRRNLDPDLLHDYRIAIRRTRSVVRLAQHHLPDKITKVWASEWRWLATTTSTPRDLDVLLAEVDDTRESLGPDTGAGLDELVERLTRQRNVAQERLAHALKGDRYGTLKRGWRYELDELGRMSAEDNGTARDLARELVARAERRLTRDVVNVNRDTPAEAIHDLRKVAKRLRYALDIFGTLLSKARVRDSLKAMKTLQDDLGAFQDAEVHRDVVARLIEGTDAPSPEARHAGTLLVARYADLADVVRADIDVRLEEFRLASGAR